MRGVFGIDRCSSERVARGRGNQLSDRIDGCSSLAHAVAGGSLSVSPGTATRARQKPEDGTEEE